MGDLRLIEIVELQSLIANTNGNRNKAENQSPTHGQPQQQHPIPRQRQITENRRCQATQKPDELPNFRRRQLDLNNERGN